MRAAAGAGLSCTGLRVRLGGRLLLEGVDLEVPAGGWLCVVGPNGAGKTTLLRALAGLQACEGEIRLGGGPLRGTRPSARARLLALVPQHPAVPPGMTVRRYVLLGRTPHLRPLGAERAVDHEVVDRVLDELGLVPYASRLLSSLSGGERQRAFLARALAQEAPLLLLDEPTTGLDLGYQQEVLDLLERLRREAGRTIVSSMHDLTLAGAYADELALVVGGRVLACGPPEQTLTEEHLALLTRGRVHLLHEQGTMVVVPLPPGVRGSGRSGWCR